MIFLDTDCISSFLWVKREHLLLGLKLGELVIPQEVFKELSNPSIPHIGRRVKELLVEGHLQTMDIMTGTEEARLFYQMVFKPTSGLPLIGKGEASVLALAKVNRGIVASNNLKDIGFYLTKYTLRNITTGYILAMAQEKKLIDEKEGNQIWAEMLARKRKLPTDSFTNYLKIIYPRDQIAASIER